LFPKAPQKLFFAGIASKLHIEVQKVNK